MKWKISGITFGPLASASSPSHVLQTQPLFESFWTKPARSPRAYEKLSATVTQSANAASGSTTRKSTAVIFHFPVPFGFGAVGSPAPVSMDGAVYVRFGSLAMIVSVADEWYAGSSNVSGAAGPPQPRRRLP